MAINFANESTGDGYILRAEQVLPRPCEEVFSFFADARNLQKLTPPWLHFRILDEHPEEMFVGKYINYRLRLRGMPMRWRSEISKWDPPHSFVDEQRIGPYKWWHHTHEFEASGSSTIVRDIVRYDFLFSRFLNKVLVQPDLERIFGYRATVLEREFPQRRE